MPPAMTGSGGAPAMTGTRRRSRRLTAIPTSRWRARVCVDTINMYRATVTTEMLAPLMRGTPDDETCSDKGAKMDGDSGVAHGRPACAPATPAAKTLARAGASAVSAATPRSPMRSKVASRRCGPKASRRSRASACQKDYQNCFLKYGHYLNMSDPGYTGVVCGFYLMTDGKSWWMNQDFKSKPWGAP